MQNKNNPCLFGDRRLHLERRRFDYSNHIPERRTGMERRDTGAASRGPNLGKLPGAHEMDRRDHYAFY
jgi:hypothetical protein